MVGKNSSSLFHIPIFQCPHIRLPLLFLAMCLLLSVLFVVEATVSPFAAAILAATAKKVRATNAMEAAGAAKKSALAEQVYIVRGSG
jgi:hypothetical protein